MLIAMNRNGQNINMLYIIRIIYSIYVELKYYYYHYHYDYVNHNDNVNVTMWQ